MYYQNYEDYMKSVLGYHIENQNTYGIQIFENQFNGISTDKNIKELENCYPEIYNLINPIICEMCDRYNQISTKDEVENMAEKIYQRLTENQELAIKLNIENKNSEVLKQTRQFENRLRRPNENQLLRDLIRILILNRLLGQGSSPVRPPSPRHPFTGGADGMFLRPPIQPRNYNEYSKYN